jgi:hypothetical protein
LTASAAAEGFRQEGASGSIEEGQLQAGLNGGGTQVMEPAMDFIGMYLHKAWRRWVHCENAGSHHENEVEAFSLINSFCITVPSLI